MEVPQGYKQTSIGIIPEDWEVKKIKAIGKVQTGNTPSTLDSNNYGNEFMFVSPSDLGQKKYISKTEKMLSSKGFSISRKFLQHSVLFTCIGSTIGKLGIASKDLTANQQINSILANENNSGEFLYYILEKNVSKIRLIAGEQAVPIINKSHFENLHFPFPPLPEQQKIAEILSTWDKAIELCQKTIEELRLRNKGLAQQLLSGRKRVKGFEDSEWSFVRFKEIYEPHKKLAQEIQYEILSVTKGGIVSQSEYFNRNVASENTSNYLVVERGDFLVSGLNFWMGSYDVLDNFEIGIISPAYKVYRLKSGYSNQFFKHFVHGVQMRFAMISASVVGASIVRRNFDLEALYEYAFKIPNFEEQKAIAKILDAAASELKHYEEKLQNLKLQKKGLMQQLLTGKVRTV